MRGNMRKSLISFRFVIGSERDGGGGEEERGTW